MHTLNNHQLVHHVILFTRSALYVLYFTIKQTTPSRKRYANVNNTSFLARHSYRMRFIIQKVEKYASNFIRMQSCTRKSAENWKNAWQTRHPNATPAPPMFPFLKNRMRGGLAEDDVSYTTMSFPSSLSFYYFDVIFAWLQLCSHNPKYIRTLPHMSFQCESHSNCKQTNKLTFARIETLSTRAKQSNYSSPARRKIISPPQDDEMEFIFNNKKTQISSIKRVMSMLGASIAECQDNRMQRPF